jgi:hypothetical protein
MNWMNGLDKKKVCSKLVSTDREYDYIILRYNLAIKSIATIESRCDLVRCDRIFLREIHGIEQTIFKIRF